LNRTEKGVVKLDKLKEIFGTEVFNEYLKSFKLDNGMNEDEGLNGELKIKLIKDISNYLECTIPIEK
jgi:hypothetical protein